MEVKLSGHGAYRHQYHIVWIPKYRRRVLKNGLKVEVEKYIREISEYHPDVKIIEMNIQVDHVHLIMEIPPRYAVAAIVGKMKQNSSRKSSKKLGKEGVFWSPGYFSSTVGLDEEAIKKYVRFQEKVDTGEHQLKLF